MANGVLAQSYLRELWGSPYLSCSSLSSSQKCNWPRYKTGNQKNFHNVSLALSENYERKKGQVEAPWTSILYKSTKPEQYHIPEEVSEINATVRDLKNTGNSDYVTFV